MWLIAQNKLSNAADPFLLLLVGLGVLVILLLLVAIAFGFAASKQAKRDRELLHLERIKAFETGTVWREPGSDSDHKKFMHNAFYISFWMLCFGCGGPFTAVGRLSTAGSTSTAVLIAAWVAAGGASVAACLCAMLLMIRSKSRQDSTLD